MSSSEAIDSTEELRRPHDTDDQETDPAMNLSMSDKDSREVYARYAKWINRFERLDRLLMSRYRHRQFASAEGSVLDVACGTGTNFRYLLEAVELVGVDISEVMLSYARDELDRLDRAGTLVRMDAQSLEFKDNSFDTVISSLSTCTFPDPVVALREMERVCEPEGRILLVEHGRSDVGLIARYQEWRADAHYAKTGCRADQEPLEIVQRAGLSIDAAETGQFGRITTIAASQG
jgi:ubiquinone/menaquinone biosynthesis C-methylase UbiE